MTRSPEEARCILCLSPAPRLAWHHPISSSRVKSQSPRFPSDLQPALPLLGYIGPDTLINAGLVPHPTLHHSILLFSLSHPQPLLALPQIVRMGPLGSTVVMYHYRRLKQSQYLVQSA